MLHPILVQNYFNFVKAEFTSCNFYRARVENSTVLPQPIISRDFYFCNDVISWCTLALQRSSRRCVSQPCVGGYQSGGGDIRVVKVVEKELVTTLLKFCCPPLPKLMGEPACSLAVKDDLK